MVNFSLCFQKRCGKFCGTERPQVVEPLTNTNVSDRQVELVRNMNDNASLGCAVQLVQHQASEPEAGMNLLHLRDAVLPCGGIEDEPDIVWRTRHFAIEHLAHFFSALPSGGPSYASALRCQ